MEWKQPQENMDRMTIFFHALLDITIIPHIIFFLLLIIYKTKNKSSKCFIIFIDFTSFISLVLPIVYSFIFTKIVIKPINLTENDYTTNNIDFNKLIEDKINNLY